MKEDGWGRERGKEGAGIKRFRGKKNKKAHLLKVKLPNFETSWIEN